MRQENRQLTRPLSQVAQARNEPVVQRQTGGNQALIPGAFQVGATIAPYVNMFNNYVQRLFSRQTPVLRQPLPLERRPGEPTAGARFSPVIPSEEIAGVLGGFADYARNIRNQNYQRGVQFAEGYPRGNLEAPGIGSLARNAARALRGEELIRNTPGTAGETQQVDPATGVIWYRMKLIDGTDSHMMNYGVSESDVDANGQITPEAQEKYLSKRADDVGLSITRNEWPQVILESDRLRLGYSNDWMRDHGYFWDEERGYWQYGVEIGEGPQVTGAAMPYTGSGYNYPRYSYPKGGGGTYQPFQSYGNYVEPGQRGNIPQQIQNRPARFGAVTWRI